MMFQKSLHSIPIFRFVWPIPVVLVLNALLPTLVGEFTFISGIFGVLREAPWTLALYYVIQMTVVLYPPFASLAVCHALYLRKKGALLLRRIQVTPADAERGAAPAARARHAAIRIERACIADPMRCVCA